LKSSGKCQTPHPVYKRRLFIENGDMKTPLTLNGLSTEHELIPTETILRAFGREDWSPPLPEWVRAWIAAENVRPAD